MSTFKLGLILIVLIGAAYLYKTPAVQDSKKIKNFLSDVSVEEIKKIEIEADGKTTVLEKINGKLKIEGTKDFYVDDEVAQKILDAISNTKNTVLDLVSNSEEKKEDFKTNESGIKIKLVQDGKDAINFVVGKLSSNFKDNYISLPSLPDTYAVTENLINIFDREDWRSRRIFKAEADAITKVRFQRPSSEFILEKKDDEWKGISPLEFKADKEKLDEVIEKMTNLTAAKIPEQTFEGTGLDQHLLIVQVTGGEVDNTIMIGTSFKMSPEDLEKNPDQKQEELYYAKSGKSDNIYLISKEDKSAIDKQIADLTK